MKFLSRATLFCFFLAFPLQPVQATNPLDLIINEVAWMGAKVEGVESKNWWRYEWLELYNNTDQPLSLAGWKIELYRTELDWELKLSGGIEPQDYFLIVASDKISPEYDLNYANLGGKFINKGQKILLKDGGGQIIDEIDCVSGWFAGDNSTKQTMERKSGVRPGPDPENWQNSQNPGGTPRAKNSLAVQAELPALKEAQSITKEVAEVSEIGYPTAEAQYPSGIVINEILPSPEGPDEKEEWIEVFNQNDFEVDLSGWQISDKIGKATIYTFPEGTKISPQGFLILSRPTTKITLNNNGDGLNLIQPSGKIIDELHYEKTLRGQSYNRVNSKRVWSSTLTPGSANIIPALLSENKEAEISKEPAPEKETEEPLAEKGLAAIGEQIPKSSQSFFILLLIALSLAIFSAIIILILKKAVKSRYNKNV